MTATLSTSRGHQGSTIRPYRPADHHACRQLWAELTDHRIQLGDPPAHSEEDTGAGFEEYLTDLRLSGLWVADVPDHGVVGFVGLTLDARIGHIDPVVVTASFRRRGIGAALLDTVRDEARRRGLTQLTITPPAGDPEAIASLHHAGFTRLASVTLRADLRGPGGRGTTRQDDHHGATRHVDERHASLSLYDLRFLV